RRPIALVGSHELVANLVLNFIDVGLRRVVGNFEEQFAGQRIAIGMQPVRGQAEDHVAGLDGFAGNDPLALDHADDEAGEIVFALGVEAGHLGRLSAYQGAAVVLAGFGDAFDDLLGDFRFEFSGSEIIHEEKGCGPLYDDVVDAVIHQVGAHGVMDFHFKSDLKFGAHAIHAGDQHGVQVLLIHRKQAAETSNLAQHTFGESFMGEILDALLGLVGAIDVHASIGIGYGGGLRLGILGHGNQSLYYIAGKLLSASLNREKRLKAAHCSTARVCASVAPAGERPILFNRRWRRSAYRRSDHPKHKYEDSFSRP